MQELLDISAKHVSLGNAKFVEFNVDKSKIDSLLKARTSLINKLH